MKKRKIIKSKIIINLLKISSDTKPDILPKEKLDNAICIKNMTSHQVILKL